jgi:polysaccharide export outer membrane protein
MKALRLALIFSAGLFGPLLWGAETAPSSSNSALLPGQIGPAIQLSETPAPPESSSPGLPPAMAALDNRQRLNPGDRITFRVIEDREEPRPLIVTDSGELEVPYVGRVKVAGKTCLEVSKELKVLLEKDYYHQATPLIQIELLNRARGRIYVHGDVRTPGHQEIPADEVLTVSKAILRAGGFGGFANKSRVIVTRRSSIEGQPDQRIVVDVADILERGRTKEDIALQADDMIYVPSRVINF